MVTKKRFNTFVITRFQLICTGTPTRYFWTALRCFADGWLKEGCNVADGIDVGLEDYEHKRQVEELIHVAGLCIEVLQQNDEYLADVSLSHV